MNDVNLIELAKQEQNKITQQPISINLKLTLLEENQIFGYNALEIFEKYGTSAQISDFAILLGGYVSSINYSSEGKSLENRAAYYLTHTNKNDKGNEVYIVLPNGDSFFTKVNVRCCGCRPALPFSSISSILSNKVRRKDGLLEIEYGEYPQKVVDKNLQKTLENLYSRNELNKTGKTYTTDSRKYDDYEKGFEPQIHVEYEYNVKKYIRVKANSFFDRYEFTLSNDEEYKDNDNVWVEVLPIKWLVDEDSNIAITKDIIIAGVQFNKERNYKGDFESTTMYWFLNEVFIKDIVSTNINSFNNNIKPKKIETLEDLKKDAEDAKRRMNEILEGTNINISGKTYTKKL